MNQLNKIKNAFRVRKQVSLQDLIRQSANELGKALPAHLNPERLVRIVLTAIRLNPELAMCTPESFLGSLFILAQMGLEPIAGRAYLVPFNNRRNGQVVKEVQAVIGYKGLTELFYRHESAMSLDMHKVYENDDFSYEYGSNSYLKHKPALKKRGEVIAYYVIAKMKGGASVFRVMSKEDAMEHGRKHSKTYDKKTRQFHWSSPWAKEPDSMCMKTVLIQVSKLLPLSVEVQRAIAVDETSRDYRRGIDNAFDLPDNTNWNEVEEPVDLIEGEPEQAPQSAQEKIDHRKITEAQLKRLMAIASEKKVSDDKIKAYIKKMYEITSKKDLERWQYEDVITFIEKGEKNN